MSSSIFLHKVYSQFRFFLTFVCTNFQRICTLKACIEQFSGIYPEFRDVLDEIWGTRRCFVSTSSNWLICEEMGEKRRHSGYDLCIICETTHTNRDEREPRVAGSVDFEPSTEFLEVSVENCIIKGLKVHLFLFFEYLKLGEVVKRWLLSPSHCAAPTGVQAFWRKCVDKFSSYRTSWFS